MLSASELARRSGIFTGAFASRRKPEFYAEFENTGKDFFWVGCWLEAAPDLEFVRDRA